MYVSSLIVAWDEWRVNFGYRLSFVFGRFTISQTGFYEYLSKLHLVQYIVAWVPVQCIVPNLICVYVPNLYADRRLFASSTFSEASPNTNITSRIYVGK